MSKNFPINLLAGEDYLPTFMWNLIHYSPSTNNTIIDLSKKKKSCNFGRPSIIGSRFVRFLIGLVVSTLATVYNKLRDNFHLVLICLLTIIPCVNAITLDNIPLHTCGPVMAGVLVAICLLTLTPAVDGQELENDEVEPNAHEQGIEELGNMLEETDDDVDFEPGLVTNDLDHTVIIHFKHYQFGPKRGTGRWLINILVGPYTYGVKKIDASEGTFHCQKCLSGYGE